MNVCVVIGNLASEVELRHTQSGKAVASFRVAVSRYGSDAADFFTVTAWERTAEICAEYLTLGRRVGVEGRLQHSTWETDKGEKRSKVEIVATKVQLLGSKQEQETASVGADQGVDDVGF